MSFQRVGEETRVVLFFAALLLGGCGSSTELSDAGVIVDGGSHDAITYESCTTICLRPADCAIAYPDGDALISKNSRITALDTTTVEIQTPQPTGVFPNALTSSLKCCTRVPGSGPSNSTLPLPS